MAENLQFTVSQVRHIEQRSRENGSDYIYNVGRTPSGRRLLRWSLPSFGEKMRKYAVVIVSLAVLCGTAFAARAPFDCKAAKGGSSYNAEISNEGTTNRSVQVTFKTKPSTAQATKIVQACVKAAVEKDGGLDALGSAWMAGKPVALSTGRFFAYLSANQKYRFM